MKEHTENVRLFIVATQSLPIIGYGEKEHAPFTKKGIPDNSY